MTKLSSQLKKDRAVGASVALTDRWIVADLGVEHQVLSWAIIGGGKQTTNKVVWLEVANKDLGVDVDPVAYLQQALNEHNHDDAVAMMTSCDITRYIDKTYHKGGLWARAIVTVGLSNALRVGDVAKYGAKVNTINIFCQVSEHLTEAGMLEGMSIVTEARTMACLESNVTSIVSNAPASGTGTDCITFVSPLDGTPLIGVGKHTVIGHLIGKAVYQAMKEGVLCWQRELQKKS